MDNGLHVAGQFFTVYIHVYWQLTRTQATHKTFCYKNYQTQAEHKAAMAAAKLEWEQQTAQQLEEAREAVLKSSVRVSYVCLCVLLALSFAAKT